MPQSLTHEMAHAVTDGDHGANWQTEMARLKGLGRWQEPLSDEERQAIERLAQKRHL